MGARFSTHIQTGPGAHPASRTMGTGSYPGGKERPGRDADLSPPSSAVAMKGQSCTLTPPKGRTACTEPQCLYKGALYLTFLRNGSFYFCCPRTTFSCTKKCVFVMFQSDVEENVSPGFPELKADVLVPKQGRKITSPAEYFVYGQNLRHVFCSI